MTDKLGAAPEVTRKSYRLQEITMLGRVFRFGSLLLSLVLVLMIKPYGLFGTVEIERV